MLHTAPYSNMPKESGIAASERALFLEHQLQAMPQMRWIQELCLWVHEGKK